MIPMPKNSTFSKVFFHLRHILYFLAILAPWTDVLLFLPLLPLGQIPKDHKINEQQLETAGKNLDVTLFDQGQWNNFATFLTQHPSNSEYSNKKPNEITWVMIMQLLRNVVSYESQLNWKGITSCMEQILLYTKTRRNFQALIHANELAIE
jgi:hypothetical protein